MSQLVGWLAEKASEEQARKDAEWRNFEAAQAMAGQNIFRHGRKYTVLGDPSVYKCDPNAQTLEVKTVDGIVAVAAKQTY